MDLIRFWFQEILRKNLFLRMEPMDLLKFFEVSEKVTIFAIFGTIEAIQYSNRP